MQIAARQTRLVRVPDLGTYQQAIAALARDGGVREARRRAVIVPTTAAARQLRRTLEASADGAAFVLPHLVTRDGWYALMHGGVQGAPPLVDAFEREIMLYAAALEARDAGIVPPFGIRARIVAGMLRFYDELRRRDCDLLKFERRIKEELSKDVDDRGAERVARQTAFLAEAFRRYERKLMARGVLDEHTLAVRIRAEGSPACAHVVVTVGDQTAEPGGLWPSDYRLLAEAPGIERIDLIATDRVLAAGLFDELQKQLPGFDDTRKDERPKTEDASLPTLIVPPPAPGDREAPGARSRSGAKRAPRGDELSGVQGTPPLNVWMHRDREEELYATVRGVRRLADADGVLRARAGIVFQRPLPYLYLARRAFEGARVPYLASDALPLAAEPYAAAVDLVLEYVWSNASRAATAALLRSPAFRFEDEAGRLGPADVTEFEQHVLSLRVPGEPESYRAIAGAPPPANPRHVKRQARAARVAAIAERCWTSLGAVANPGAAVGARVDALIAFLQAHEAPPPSEAEPRERHLRARAAILSAIGAIGRAADLHALTLSTDELTATIRRWIEEQTFAPRRGDGGVELVDATAARYGRFDHLRVLGLVESDWPVRPARNVFYGRYLLDKLDWPDEQKRLALAYAAFKDLVCLPASTLALSAFHLDDDAIVGLSPYIDAVSDAGLPRDIDRALAGAETMHFPWEALVARPALTGALEGEAAAWAAQRVERGDLSGDRYRGQTGAFEPGAYSVSALETYLRCPFRYFASKVLKLPEERDDEPGMTPQERGHFLHDVVRQFYASWDASPGGPVTGETLDAALARFRDVAEAALASLPPADRAQERTLLLGSAASPGLAERLLYFEMQLPGRAARRILEERAEGEFEFTGDQGTRTIALHAVADRIDVLEGDGLRVVDYKLGRVPDKDIALQLPVYGLCQSRALSEPGGVTRSLTAAAYFSFNHRYEPKVYEGADVETLLEDGQARLVQAVDAIERGEFPARPHDPRECTWCAYPSICRKEYAGDE
ncbi:MAG TPA: PD-(D/E)XK nuclease family protein [Vicinamibacterales bacterium]|nr:PD-(D/E)XK nuclease family protein [Vicinamibacterales bacterium]